MLGAFFASIGYKIKVTKKITISGSVSVMRTDPFLFGKIQGGRCIGMEFSIKIILDNIYQKLSFKKAGRAGQLGQE